MIFHGWSRNLKTIDIILEFYRTKQHCWHIVTLHVIEMSLVSETVHFRLLSMSPHLEKQKLRGERSRHAAEWQGHWRDSSPAQARISTADLSWALNDTGWRRWGESCCHVSPHLRLSACSFSYLFDHSVDFVTSFLFLNFVSSHD